MAKGYLALILHSHLPYVRHPEYGDCLEERWFFEAMTETYIPLLDTFERLAADGVDFRIAMSLTPPLVSMMTDPFLQERYQRHLEGLIQLAEKEVERTRWMLEFHDTARMYLERFRRCHAVFADGHKRNIAEGFRRLQDAGKIEILACSATHGFLPLLRVQENAVRAQVAVGVDYYQRVFGRAPRGMWNAECGYYPGLDAILREHAIRYFPVDTHGLLFANKRPRYGVFAPLFCPSGVAAFGRDHESSKSVWSAEEGYPGDYNYREFYRDVGYDLDWEYVRPYIHESGLRISTGMKYFRITGKRTSLADKQPYDRGRALETAASHAGNFMFNREKQVEHLAAVLDRPPIIVAPYDTELFGHWWFEGPEFLDFLIRKIHYDQKTFELITPSDYLERHPENQVATPSLSSWGNKGYCEVWLEGSNDWIYRHLHKAGEQMIGVAYKHREAEGVLRRALNQAARELLLAQSSDWAFIMKTRTMVHYAERRVKDHMLRFGELCAMIRRNEIDERYLSEIEEKDNIFPEIDYRVYTNSAT